MKVYDQTDVTGVYEILRAFKIMDFKIWKYWIYEAKCSLKDEIWAPIFQILKFC